MINMQKLKNYWHMAYCYNLRKDNLHISHNVPLTEGQYTGTFIF